MYLCRTLRNIQYSIKFCNCYTQRVNAIYDCVSVCAINVQVILLFAPV